MVSSAAASQITVSDVQEILVAHAGRCPHRNATQFSFCRGFMPWPSSLHNHDPQASTSAFRRGNLRPELTGAVQLGFLSNARADRNKLYSPRDDQKVSKRRSTSSTSNSLSGQWHSQILSLKIRLKYSLCQSVAIGGGMALCLKCPK